MKSKNIIYIIIIVLVIAGGVFALVKNHNSKTARKDLSFSEAKQLQAEEKKKVFEARLKDLQDQVGALASDASASTKYTSYISLAEVQIELEKYQDAIKSLDSIPDEKKGNSRVKLDYGLAYKGIGEIVKAREALKDSLAMDETSGPAWAAYLELLQDLPKDELKALYIKAAHDTDNYLDIVIAAAHFMESVGDKEKAIAYWEAARNVNPDGAGDYDKEITRLRQ